MPIYEYECEKCGKVTEALRRMSQADDPLVCESCGSKQTHRCQSEFAANTSKGQVGSSHSSACGCGSCCGGHGSCGLH